MGSWNRYYKSKDDELINRMVFVENGNGEKVATASAFYGICGRDKSGTGWIHRITLRLLM